MFDSAEFSQTSFKQNLADFLRALYSLVYIELDTTYNTSSTQRNKQHIRTHEYKRTSIVPKLHLRLNFIKLYFNNKYYYEDLRNNKLWHRIYIKKSFLSVCQKSTQLFSSFNTPVNNTFFLFVNNLHLFQYDCGSYYIAQRFK